MRRLDIDRVVRILRLEAARFRRPSVGIVALQSQDPFLVLVSCILSLRTQDQTTAEASARLFRLASTPEQMLQLSERTIVTAIYPVGFYRVKARTIRTICSDLVERWNSRVPAEIDDLLRLKGVGRKTANLVVTLGYGQPGICVDTHVHRIANRLGYVRTKEPDQTETALRRRLPREYWIELNELLVTYGQNICRPVSPRCGECRLADDCARVGVSKRR